MDPASIANLFKLTWKTAFALSLALPSTIFLRRTGYLTDATDITIGYFGTFGFWYLIAIILDALGRIIRTHGRQQRIARNESERAKRAEAEALAAKEQAASAEIEDAERKRLESEEASRLKQEAEALDRERSLQNLRNLHEWEEATLRWIYHRRKGRSRASIHYSGVQGLFKMGLLKPETDKGVDWTDRIFVIPDHITKALHELLGEPDPEKVNDKPPWERRRI